MTGGGMNGALRPKAGSTWGVPAVLALASLVGLLAALLGDGAWDVLAAGTGCCAWMHSAQHSGHWHGGRGGGARMPSLAR